MVNFFYQYEISYVNKYYLKGHSGIINNYEINYEYNLKS